MNEKNERKRLLIVDDEPIILASLKRAFTIMNYDVTDAMDGQQALEYLEDQRFDLMILDLQMPGIHGTEVMHLARQRDRSILIIVLTGTATLESAIEAIRANAANFLLKPVGVNEVVEAVEEAFNSHSEEQQRQRVMDMLVSMTEPFRQSSTTEGGPSLENGYVTVELDMEQRMAHLPDRNEIIALTEGEATVLQVFLSTPRQVLACRDLARLAFEYDMEEIEAQTLVRPYIFRLRQKLETDPTQPRLIRTIRGRGYLWNQEY